MRVTLMWWDDTNKRNIGTKELYETFTEDIDEFIEYYAEEYGKHRAKAEGVTLNKIGVKEKLYTDWIFISDEINDNGENYKLRTTVRVHFAKYIYE